MIPFGVPAGTTTLRQVRMKTVSLAATRRSLVDRLVNWDDQKRWQEFFDTYWRLIYSTARKAGLTDAEAQEVVQETVITVAKKIDKLKYDPAIGSFKGWLLQITRWRIVDQFRKREPGDAKRTTASVSYTRGEWSSSVVWGQIYKESHDVTLDAWLAESTVKLFRRHHLRVRRLVLQR